MPIGQCVFIPQLSASRHLLLECYLYEEKPVVENNRNMFWTVVHNIAVKYKSLLLSLL